MSTHRDVCPWIKDECFFASRRLLRPILNVGLFLLFTIGSLPLASSQVTIQLPTTRVFTSNSSYWVPDGGAVYGGGVLRSGYGGTQRGAGGLSRIPGLGPLFGNRAGGRQTSSTGIVTTAQIISVREIGDGILAGTHDRYGRRISTSSHRPGSRLTGGFIDFVTRPSFQRPSGKPTTATNVDSRPSAKLVDVYGYRIKTAGGRRGHSGKQITNNMDAIRPAPPTADEIARKAAFLKRYLGRKK